MSSDRLLRALLISALGATLPAGCADRRENPTFPDIHPDAWMDPADGDFHGTRVLDVGAQACYSCHGEDASGGMRAPACFECHDPATECVTCHGGLENDTGAPPRDLSGNETPDAIGVGAHQSHLTEGPLRVAVECDECHDVPETVADAGHIEEGADYRAEITWGPLADTEGSAGTDPVYIAGESPRCADVYCHGGGFEDAGQGTLVEPTWTILDGSQAECGTCHALPPHDPFGSCEFCHGSVVEAVVAGGDTSYTITDAGKSLHINGQTDF